jgi:DNA-directed RNA polymerase specialized sigma24 family protein
LDAPSAAAPPCGGPAEAASALREAAAQLTPRQREAFGLLLLGHKPVAVAQQMGIDADNARVTLHHARQRLGRILGWSADEVSRVIQLCQVQASEGRRTVPAA